MCHWRPQTVYQRFFEPRGTTSFLLHHRLEYSNQRLRNLPSILRPSSTIVISLVHPSISTIDTRPHHHQLSLTLPSTGSSERLKPPRRLLPRHQCILFFAAASSHQILPTPPTKALGTPASSSSRACQPRSARLLQTTMATLSQAHKPIQNLYCLRNWYLRAGCRRPS